MRRFARRRAGCPGWLALERSGRSRPHARRSGRDPRRDGGAARAVRAGRPPRRGAERPAGPVRHPGSLARLRARVAPPLLHGRLDLAHDGAGPPRLLECNADTPTGLIESAAAPWRWLADTHPGADQFNPPHGRLVARLRAIRAVARQPGMAVPVLHVSSVDDGGENRQTARHIQDVATQAGWDARSVALADVGCSGQDRCFVASKASRFGPGSSCMPAQGASTSRRRPFQADGGCAALGSWVVGDAPAGIVVREDRSPTCHQREPRGAAPGPGLRQARIGSRFSRRGPVPVQRPWRPG